MTVRTSFLRTLGFVFALVAGASSSWASPNTAAKAFIATLSDEERRLALTSFDDSDRTEWRLTPGSRGGLSMGRMDRATLNATMGLLATVLSKKGLELVSEIRKREAALDELEGGSGYRDPNKYYLALFGTPGAQQWGLRFEGHHLTFNISLSGDKIVSVLPYSFGSNPDRMPDSGKRLVTDILKRAAATVKTGSNGISRLLENLLDVFPTGIAAQTAKALRPKLAAGTAKGEDGEYEIEGRGASISTVVQGENHYHIEVSDRSLDFAGR